MTFCQRCGAVIDPEARRKSAPELPMIIECPHCGAKNMRTEAFCGKCDMSLDVAKTRLIEEASQGREPKSPP
jgi:DNA-directed RNA polymerase subunit M/transcription elongation factor TFIIS